jgi:hypothetical protein
MGCSIWNEGDATAPWNTVYIKSLFLIRAAQSFVETSSISSWLCFLDELVFCTIFSVAYIAKCPDGPDNMARGMNASRSHIHRFMRQFSAIADGVNVNMQSDFASYEHDAASLPSKLDMASDEKGKMQSELDTTKSDNTGLQSQLDMGNAANERLQSELDTSKGDTVRLQCELDT